MICFPEKDLLHLPIPLTAKEVKKSSLKNPKIDLSNINIHV
jgi:hypothetical protein